MNEDKKLAAAAALDDDALEDIAGGNGSIIVPS